MFLLDYPYCKAELSDALQEKRALITREDSSRVLLLSALIGDYLLHSHLFRLICSLVESSICSCLLSVKYQAAGG